MTEIDKSRSLIGFPEEQGLYNPKDEKDACGFGFIANIDNIAKHEIIHQALEIVHNLDHRGAVGADPLAGDGAGILIQIPNEFFISELQKNKITLPSIGEYAVGMIFFPKDKNKRLKLINLIEKVVDEEGQKIIYWRDVPVDSSVLGESVKSNEPCIK